MKKIMVFGTFDLFHPGHKNFLKQAKKYGDYLVVVVARDKTVEEIKKQRPKNRETERAKVLSSSKIADEVVLGNLGDKYKVIKRHKPDIICLGYDQKFFVRGLKEKLKSYGLETKVIRLKPYKPEICKSSKLKNNSMVAMDCVRNP